MHKDIHELFKGKDFSTILSLTFFFFLCRRGLPKCKGYLLWNDLVGKFFVSEILSCVECIVTIKNKKAVWKKKIHKHVTLKIKKKDVWKKKLFNDIMWQNGYIHTDPSDFSSVKNEITFASNWRSQARTQDKSKMTRESAETLEKLKCGTKRKFSGHTIREKILLPLLLWKYQLMSSYIQPLQVSDKRGNIILKELSK